MKKLYCLALLMLFMSKNAFSYPIPKPFPPFHIAGNLYYVGTDDLASYLIVTSEGNILINSNLESGAPEIKKSIEALGFKFSDTKILLISHAHLDHAEGCQWIKQQTEAKYMVMDADVALVESGGRTDFHYANDKDMYFPTSKVDRELHDGDKIKLGDTVLTAHLTPGHTPGCTTWSMQVNDKGKTYDVVIVGSVNVNPGYQLINNKTYPSIAKDFKKALTTLKSLPCDIFLGAHAVYFDLKNKYELLSQNKSNPFIDSSGYKKHVLQKENEFNKEFAKQKL